MTPRADPRPPAASGPVLQCVRTRRAPASSSAPATAIASLAAEFSASIACASARAAAAMRAGPAASAAARTRSTAQPRFTAVGRAARSVSAARSRAPEPRLAGDLQGDAVGGGDPDHRGPAHREPADRLGDLAGRRRLQPDLGLRQPRLIEQAQHGAVPGERDRGAPGGHGGQDSRFSISIGAGPAAAGSGFAWAASAGAWTPSVSASSPDS